MSAKSFIYTICFAIFFQFSIAQIHVWPSPQRILINQEGEHLSISNAFRFALKGKGQRSSYRLSYESDFRTKSMARVKRGIARINAVLKSKNENYDSGKSDGRLRVLALCS